MRNLASEEKQKGSYSYMTDEVISKLGLKGATLLIFSWRRERKEHVDKEQKEKYKKTNTAFNKEKYV